MIRNVLTENTPSQPTSWLSTARDDPELLAEQLAIADPIAYKEFFAVAQTAHREKVLMLFQAELAKKVPASGNDRQAWRWPKTSWPNGKPARP